MKGIHTASTGPPAGDCEELRPNQDSCHENWGQADAYCGFRSIQQFLHSTLVFASIGVELGGGGSSSG